MRTPPTPPTGLHGLGTATEWTRREIRVVIFLGGGDLTEEWRSALVLVLIALAVTVLIALGWAMIAPR
jgi:hypothetical protein